MLNAYPLRYFDGIDSGKRVLFVHSAGGDERRHRTFQTGRPVCRTSIVSGFHRRRMADNARDP
ncbi:MAG: hypothetical protein MZV64_23865 [Ignavibacteriales bacterium]|nr:hypothetical protein [Ignavibacteriales bacterium]